MKVLVISHEYPPIGGGGGKVVQDLCSGLAARGHHIHLLTALYENLPVMETAGNFVIERLPSKRTESFRADFVTMASFVWKSFWRGLKVIRTWHPDLIHAHFAVPAGAVAYALSVLTRTPYIITAHGGDVPGGAPEKTGGWFRFVLPFSKPVWKHAAAIAAVSSQTRQLALKHYAADIQVIPNGIDPSAYHPGNFNSKKNARDHLYRQIFTRKERTGSAAGFINPERPGLGMHHAGRRPADGRGQNADQKAPT